MCIIVAKKSGVEIPKMETLKRCFNNNSDGAGLMYHKNGTVFIEKGFMTWTDFEDRVNRLKREIDTTKEGIVFHFRIGTAGTNSKENCHPYMISSNYDKLHSTRLKTNIGVAHNGILHDYNPTKSEEEELNINDTQKFIAQVLTYFKKQHGTEFTMNKQVVDIISNLLGTSKLAFLDNDNRVSLIGAFVEENGVYYSNSTYSYDRYSYRTYYDYDYGYGWGKDLYDTKATKKEDTSKVNTKSTEKSSTDNDMEGEVPNEKEPIIEDYDFDSIFTKEYVLNNLDLYLNPGEKEIYTELYNNSKDLKEKYRNAEDYIYDILMSE